MATINTISVQTPPMIQKVFQTYLRRLTNLSGNNKSLLLLKLAATQDLDMHRLDYLCNQPSFVLINRLIAREKNIPLCQLVDSRNAANNEVSQQLKKIDRQSKTIREERGAEDLYVGWPFVHGKFMDGTPVRCPLIFIPVTLELKNNQWILGVRDGEPMTFNKSFLLAHAHYNKTAVSEELMEETFEAFPEDILEFRTTLYELMKKSGIELNFNRDLFLNTLTQFNQYKKADYEAAYGPGQLKLQAEAVLGLFPQADSYLVPDYNFLLEKEEIQDLEGLFGTGEENNYAKNIREEHTFTAFPIDAAQESALKAVKAGKSLVVQGPPGTGKSQLISNLITDFVASGKKVLLVSQKRAALDVVYERLKQAGLENFTALVHDFKSDRKEIYAKIAKQAESIDEYRNLNNNLDAIYLERNFVQIGRQIDQISAQLDEFRFALFDNSECGSSVKELYMTSDQHGPAVLMDDYYKYFPFSEVQGFIQKLNRFFGYAPDFEEKDYAWKNRRSFARLSFSDQQTISKILTGIAGTKQEFIEKTEALSLHSISLGEAEEIVKSAQSIERFLQLLADPVVFRYYKLLQSSKASEKALAALKVKLFQCFEGRGMETSVQKYNLEAVVDHVEKAIEASESSFDWYKWKFFSSTKRMVEDVLNSNGLVLDKDSLLLLQEKLRKRMGFEKLVNELKQISGVSDVPRSLVAEDFEKWFQLFEKTLYSKKLFASLPELVKKLNIEEASFELISNSINELLHLCRKLLQEHSHWAKYLTAEQIEKVWHEPASAAELSRQLEYDFDALVEYDKLRESLHPHEMQVLLSIYSYMVAAAVPENLFVATAPGVFMNSLRLAWIRHIEEKYPILRAVSSKKMNQLQQELQHFIEEKRKISNEILLLRAREKTYQTVSYNRLQNRTTYREVYHQVTKKKKIWPVRKLIEAYSEELFNLVPCWMASPESVSALFPMQKMFDLVIFDEASQCFAEKGIPAMYRGQQVVIAGDEKQLQPNNLYQARWEEEDDDMAVLEVDSLLKLASYYLPQQQLTEHYRSQSLDLIEFSNKHFYKNSLRLLPDYVEINKDEPAIKYINTFGLWKNNSNETEAREVVNLVLKLLRGQDGKTSEAAGSIGVVTFNSKQQTLIQDRLEEAFMQEKLAIPEGLFVKNIENVQGDERDIIIFSIGYAPDEKGAFAMQFGSLNAEGGENRLNVAVTRARKQVYVVSSVWPGQLKTEATMHLGPKLLKAYLQYALDVSERKNKPKPIVSKEIQREWMLKYKLQNEHKALAFELPFADLTVKTYHRYKALVLTDDDLYFQSHSAKDMHAYTPMVMQQKNWKVLQIYSREYWANKKSLVQRLCTFIDNELAYKSL